MSRRLLNLFNTSKARRFYQPLARSYREACPQPWGLRLPQRVERSQHVGMTVPWFQALAARWPHRKWALPLAVLARCVQQAPSSGQCYSHRPYHTSEASVSTMPYQQPHHFPKKMFGLACMGMGRAVHSGRSPLLQSASPQERLISTLNDIISTPSPGSGPSAAQTASQLWAANDFGLGLSKCHAQPPSRPPSHPAARPTAGAVENGEKAGARPQPTKGTHADWAPARKSSPAATTPASLQAREQIPNEAPCQSCGCPTPGAAREASKEDACCQNYFQGKVDKEGRLVLRRDDVDCIERWQALGKFLSSSRGVRRLRLQGMEISKKEAQQLGKGVLKEIRHITFCQNSIGLNARSLEYICAILVCCELLESAAFISQSLGDAHLPLLMDFASKSAKLTSLSLCWNGITNVDSILPRLNQCSSPLRVVDLSNNLLGPAVLMAIASFTRSVPRMDIRTGRPVEKGHLGGRTCTLPEVRSKVAKSS